MLNNGKYISKFFKTVSLPLIVVTINLLILLFPQHSIQAAKEGLSLWYKNVLPSLLPFLIGTNILSSIGFVNFIGTILEPIMVPIFGVPGCGGFALSVGLLSGYPMGAKVTSSLYEEGKITKSEGERLLSFANNSGPLFVIGAVGTSMFSNAYVGYFILLAHYLSSITTGILFRFYNRSKKPPKQNEKHIFRKAFKALQDAKCYDPRPFGAKLGDSVAKAMETILQIGGFIILFCVIVRILEVTNVFLLLETLLSPLCNRLGIPTEIYKGVLTGIIEITNGLKILSENGITKSSLIASAALISWSGFSIHAQSISFIGKTNINSFVYLISKFINSMFSILYGFLLFPIFQSKLLSVESAIVSNVHDVSISSKFLQSSYFFILTLFSLLVICFIVLFLRKIIFSIKRYKRI